MGSKPKAPKADPAQLALAQKQAGLMQRQLDFTENMYTNQLLPAMYRQEQLGLRQYEDQKALQDTAQAWALEDRQQADQYLDSYEDAINARYNESGRQEARGLAVAGARQGASDAAGQTMRGLSRMGVNAGDPKYAMMLAQNNLQGNLAAAQAANITDQALRAEGLNARGALASMRSGNAGGYLGMAGNLGNSALAAAGSGLNAYMAGAGSRNAGMGLAGQFGNNANQGYNSYFQNQLASFNAQQQAGGGLGSALGGIAGGVAGSFFGPLGSMAGKAAGEAIFGGKKG